MKKTLLFAALVFCLTACWEPREPDAPLFTGKGYRPIYAAEETVKNITIREGTPLVSPGKIYTLDPYLFINEKGKGVHIFDNSDSTKPVNLSFISISGNYDMAVKGTWLYVDNVNDLVVMDISNPRAPKLVKRVKNAIEQHNYPPVTNTYFECVDPKNGIVIDWELVSMDTQPKCRR